MTGYARYRPLCSQGAGFACALYLDDVLIEPISHYVTTGMHVAVIGKISNPLVQADSVWKLLWFDARSDNRTKIKVVATLTQQGREQRVLGIDSRDSSDHDGGPPPNQWCAISASFGEPLKA